MCLCVCVQASLPLTVTLTTHYPHHYPSSQYPVSHYITHITSHYHTSHHIHITLSHITPSHITCTNSHITPSHTTPHYTSQVNGHQVSREIPSAVKKLLKPHKNVLQLVIERVKKTNNDTGQALSPFQSEEWNEEHGKHGSIALSADSTPIYRRRTQVSTETPSQGSPSMCVHYVNNSS